MTFLGTSAQRRVALTFLDQGVSSGSNFITGIAVARLAGPSAFGEYMVVFAIWLVTVGLHRALITEPVIVISERVNDLADLTSEGVTAEVILGIGVSLVVALGGLATLVAGGATGTMMLALSPCFVSLLVQDYWRAMSYQRRRPGLALFNDLVFLVVQLVAIGVVFRIGWRSPGWVVAAWGLGATAGAVLGFAWFPPFASLPRAWKRLRAIWPMSRWMLADFVTAFMSDQAFLVVAILLLPRVEYGGFRAAFSLMGPTVVILLAGGNIGLPEAARRAHSSGSNALQDFARRLTYGTASAVAVYGIAVALAARVVLRTVYGATFARFAPLVVLAVIQYLLLVSAFGCVIALKAAGRIRRLWLARLVIAAASLSSLFVLVHLFGTDGAGWAGVATGLSYVIVMWTVYGVEFGGNHRGGSADLDMSFLAGPVPSGTVPAASVPPILLPQEGV